MNLLQTIILGVVEGLTEFLPISSTAHLILASRALGISQTDFLKTFDIVIQLGAILSVFSLFGKRFLEKEVLKRIAAGVIPAFVLGFLLYDTVKQSFFESYATILWALALGGIFIIIFERLHRENGSAADDVKNISMPKAFGIGIFQAMAIIPGVSRSGATIIGGLLLGLKRVAIVEFSFLLAVPTMLAASGFDVLQNAQDFRSGDIALLATGFIVSFIIARLTMEFLLKFVKTHNFTVFGVYRIILAAAFWFFIFG